MANLTWFRKHISVTGHPRLSAPGPFQQLTRLNESRLHPSKQSFIHLPLTCLCLARSATGAISEPAEYSTQPWMQPKCPLPVASY